MKLFHNSFFMMAPLKTSKVFLTHWNKFKKVTNLKTNTNRLKLNLWSPNVLSFHLGAWAVPPNRLHTAPAIPHPSSPSTFRTSCSARTCAVTPSGRPFLDTGSEFLSTSVFYPRSWTCSSFVTVDLWDSMFVERITANWQGHLPQPAPTACIP